MNESNEMDAYYDDEIEQIDDDINDSDLNGYINELYTDNEVAVVDQSANQQQFRDTACARPADKLYDLTVKKVGTQMVYDFTCNFCKNNFIGSKAILSHLKDEHKKIQDFYECRECDFASRYRASLSRHNRNTHLKNIRTRKNETIYSSPIHSANYSSNDKYNDAEIVDLEADENSLARKTSTETGSVSTSATTAMTKDDKEASPTNCNQNMSNETRILRSASKQDQNLSPAKMNIASAIVSSTNSSPYRNVHRPRPNSFINPIFKKYQCSVCFLKSRNTFDLRKHINMRHGGKAEITLNKDFVGSYRAHRNNNLQNLAIERQQANYVNNSESLNTRSLSETNGSTVHNSISPMNQENTSSLLIQQTGTNGNSRMVLGNTNEQFETRLGLLESNYKALNMSVTNIDTRLTTLDSRMNRVEDKLDAILKLLQKHY